MTFIQARNFTPAGSRQIRLLVIHDMEAPERAGAAEAVASYFAGPNAPRASAHYCIDSDSYVQCVKDSDVAWAAPNANSDGLHFEHAGYARQSEAEWLDPYSKAMLEISAKLVAAKCKQYGIPAVKLTPAEVAAGKKGICGHYDMTCAYPGTGTHTDPGPNFPWAYYLARVKHYLSPISPKVRSLRAKTGYWNWLAWTLGEGPWKGYHPSDRNVRPNVPKRIPLSWWAKREAFLFNRKKGVK